MRQSKTGKKRSLSPVEVLLEYFPPRPFKLKLFNRKYYVNYEAVPVFADDHVLDRHLKAGPGERLTSWPDVGRIEILYGIAFSDKEVTSLHKKMEDKNWERTNCLVAIPMKVLQFTQVLGEIVAFEELMGEKAREEGSSEQVMLREMVDRLKLEVSGALNAENFHWYWKGKMLVEQTGKGRNGPVSGLLMKVLDSLPILPVRVSGLRRKEVLWLAMERLLAAEEPLIIPMRGGDEIQQIFRECLERNEILEKTFDGGSYAEYEVKRTPLFDSPLRGIWNVLNSHLTGSGLENKVTSCSDLCQELARPPFGLLRDGVSLLLAAYLRAFQGMLQIRGSGKEKPERLSPDILWQMLESPQEWEILYSLYSEGEREYLEEVIRVFSGNAVSEAKTNLWEEAKFSILRWFATVPMLAWFRVEKEGGPEAELLRLINDTEKTASATEFMKVHLPEAMAYPRFNPASASDRGNLLGKLLKVKMSVMSIVKEREIDFLHEVANLFQVPSASENDLERAMRAWVKGLHPKTREQALSGDARAVIDLALAESPLRERLFGDLPSAMGIGPVVEWERDNFQELANRIAHGKQEAEFWRLKQFLPLPPGVDTKAYARKWVLELMEAMGYPQEEQEGVLVELIERAYDKKQADV